MADSSSGQDELREQILHHVDEILVWTAQYAHDVALTGETKPDDDIDQYAQQKTDEIMSLVAHHTQEAVAKARLEQAILARDAAEHRIHESSAAWAIYQELEQEVNRLKASTNQPKLNQGESDAI